MSILVRGVVRRFGSSTAVDDVSFEVQGGQLVGLLGPSGSGKSTLLRIIAGLEKADAGTVFLDGIDVTTSPVQRRGVGFVFQHYALFRHMTVRQNVAFGLEIRKLPPREVRDRVDELLELIRMPNFADRYPAQLSGGQRQRVALARALAPRPRVLLLDEPFGALDATVREELRLWLRNLHDEVHVTTLFVTHDQTEAFEVSDQLILLNRGRVEQAGPAQELYENPATPFVTEFLGGVNVLRGWSRQGRAFVGRGLELPAGQSVEEGPVSVYVRPHDVVLDRIHLDEPCWSARVDRMTSMGAMQRLDIELVDGTRLEVELTTDRSRELALAVGDSIYASPREPKVFPFVD